MGDTKKLIVDTVIYLSARTRKNVKARAAIMSWNEFSKKDKLMVIASIAFFIFEAGVILSLFMLVITQVSK